MPFLSSLHFYVTSPSALQGIGTFQLRSEAAKLGLKPHAVLLKVVQRKTDRQVRKREICGHTIGES